MNEKGTVKSYLSLKGFGFILGENGKDIFFHIKHASKKNGRIPKTGDAVVFKKTSNEKGFNAEPWAFEDEVEQKKSLPQEIVVDFGIPHSDKWEKKSRRHGKSRDRYNKDD